MPAASAATDSMQPASGFFIFYTCVPHPQVPPALTSLDLYQSSEHANMTTPPIAASEAEQPVLLTSERWSENQVLQIMQDNLTAFMGELDTDEQHEYLRLCNEQIEREKSLSDALNDFYRDLNQQLLNTLENALKAKAGQAINASTTYLKTRVRQLPVSQDDLPANNRLSDQVRIYKEDLGVREYERSLTLLEAAYRNFGYTAYFSTEEQRASYISGNAISVKDFVAVARSVDIGKQINDFIEQWFKERLSNSLFGLQGTKLMIALYDAYRTNEAWSIGAQEFNNLKNWLFDNSIHWDLYQLDAGGEKIAMPFFTRRFDTPDGPRVFSYFPDRPNGALRGHSSQQEAVDSLQSQIRNDVGLKQFSWFMKAISLNNQEKIRTFIKPLSVNRDELYWHARILYDLFASTTPNRQKLTVEHYGEDIRCLAQTLPIHQSWPIQSDLVRLARTSKLADRDATVALLTYLVSETLSMLLIPVPGGVTGLSKVMLVAMLGTLVYQTTEAISALRRGQQAELVQAAGDILDLLIGLRLQGAAGKLSARRTRKLMNALGNPGYAIATDGKPTLWYIDAYAGVDPRLLDGVEQNAQGLYEKDHQLYIQLHTGRQSKFANVTLESSTGRYRLADTSSSVQPFVTYSRKYNRWTVDTVDTRALSDAQLLQQMISPSQLSLNPTACQRALDVAGLDRQGLLDVWLNHRPVPTSLTQAVENQYLREGISQLQTALTRNDSAMPDIADQVLPALLADLGRCTIKLYNPEGTRLLSSHAPLLAANEQPHLPIELRQIGNNRYRTRATDSPVSSLIHQVLFEHERSGLDSSLGKTGPNSEGQPWATRLLALKIKLALHLDAHQNDVYEAIRSDRTRQHLAVTSNAFRFSPTTRIDKPSQNEQAIELLRRRFPDLSHAAAADLLQQHASLRDISEYSALDLPLREATHKSLEQSTITEALGALSDSSVRGFNAQSEALFFHLVTLLPGWQTDVAVMVYQGDIDAQGRITDRGPLLDIYGSEVADTFVMLVKSGNRYAGYRQGDGDVHSSTLGENNLISVILSTLTDGQRNALGRERHDTAGLTQDVLGQAKVHQEFLQEFLIPSRELPLSSHSLLAFRAINRKLPPNADGDGIHDMGTRKYVNIDNVAYQVMLDSDASSPVRKVWRIVKPQDPVAMDDGNRYNSSRAGETRAITRNAANLWVGALVGATGGMRRAEHGWSFHRQLAERATAVANRLLRNPQTRAGDLFPTFGKEQIKAFIRSLGEDVAGGLTRHENEYGALKRTLKDWTQANARASSSTASGPAGAWAQLVALEIRRCWRRETGAVLKLPSGGGVLPAITADFSHVRNLDLGSVSWSSAADTFLANFSRLERLTIANSTLDRLPAAIGEMSQLTALDLRSSHLKLDTPNAARLSQLSQLQNINLSNNPLEMTPDFSAMSGLKVVDLHRTGIDQWPTGLHYQTSLQTIDLRFNRLREMPQTHLNPAADQVEVIAMINAATLLDGNDFPPGHLEQFEVNARRLNRVPDATTTSRPETVDDGMPSAERVQRLYPTKSTQEANTFLNGLGDGAAAELTRLEQELSTLQSQLDNWSFSGGSGARHQYIRSNQLGLNAATRDDRYTARDRILSCWRRETPQQISAANGQPIGLDLNLGGLNLPSLPDLDADFSHVGSLRLNNMNLSTSPEGFLTRYRHLRWLNMAGNQLRELPPAVGEMNGLTRLALQHNQIRLTPETARILSERGTLRAISLAGNPIGSIPDFSQMTDLRVLNLRNTGIESWPAGVGRQPALELIQLSENRMTTIPDSVIEPPDNDLARVSRVNHITEVTGNPLSEATIDRVRNYAVRLLEAGLTQIGRPNRLALTAINGGLRIFPDSRVETPFRQWTSGLVPDQIAARSTQWHTLRQQQGADAFFILLERLEPLGAGQADLQRRVWAVIDAITENNMESERLRQEIFDRAGEPKCCDRAAFSFGNLETTVMVYRARTLAMDQSQGAQLSTLSRGLLRLHEVDRIASADIQRSEAVINDPAAPEAEKRRHRIRLNEEVEIRLAYRHGLKDRLQLPGQPARVAFTHMVGVTQTMLDAAYEKVVALDNSPEEFQALVSREFWQDYVTNKYRPQFEAQRQPYQERLDVLRDRFASQELSESDYRAQTNDQQAQLAIEEAELIQTLTRQELAEHAQSAAGSNPSEEKTTAPSR
jgi:Leucine-rich repeat (LRR) protein